MPPVNGFVNVSPAYRLIRIPASTYQKRRCLLSRVPVVVLKDVGICLEKEPDISVPDQIALRVIARQRNSADVRLGVNWSQVQPLRVRLSEIRSGQK